MLPHEVPLLQEARRKRKAALICNFVDREGERPALCPKDFFPLPMISHTEDVNQTTKQTGKQRYNIVSLIDSFSCFANIALIVV